MQDGNAPRITPTRLWRIIADELSKEMNPKRVLELATELNYALEEQGLMSPDAGDGDARHPLPPIEP